MAKSELGVAGSSSVGVVSFLGLFYPRVILHGYSKPWLLRCLDAATPALSWGQAPKPPFSLRSMADRVQLEIERSENGGLGGTPRKESVAS